MHVCITLCLKVLYALVAEADEKERCDCDDAKVVLWLSFYWKKSYIWTSNIHSSIYICLYLHYLPLKLAFQMKQKPCKSHSQLFGK